MAGAAGLAVAASALQVDQGVNPISRLAGFVIYSTPVDLQTPFLRRGFAFMESVGSVQTATLQIPSRTVIVHVQGALVNVSFYGEGYNLPKTRIGDTGIYTPTDHAGSAYAAHRGPN